MLITLIFLIAILHKSIHESGKNAYFINGHNIVEMIHLKLVELNVAQNATRMNKINI